MPTDKVLVLGEDTRSFLSVVRSLGRSGLEVHVAACPSNSPSRRSRYVHHAHVLPVYRREGSDWLQAMVRLLEAGRFDLVVPCHDSGLLPLHAHRDALEKLPGIYLLGEEVFEICFSKARTYELAERLAIPVPRQRVARTRMELEGAAAEFGFPLVLKPNASAGLENPAARKMVRKMWRREDLTEVNLAHELLVQENFNGIGVGVETLCQDGEILTAFQHERVHEPLMGGGSSYRKSAPLDPGLLAATQKIMSVLRYTGVAMVEFKLNPRSRAWALIEINSRFWGSLPLSIAAGIDFPRYLYDLLVLGRKSYPRQYHVGLYARNWLKDLRWMLQNLRADRSDPDLMTQPLGQVARELFNPLLLRESSDTLVWDDPMPAFAEVAQVWRERVWPRVELLFRSRGGLHRRALDAIREARHVLFICKGNICRSPFAEEALRSSGFRGTCASCGMLPLEGRPSPKEAIEAAARLGIDLRARRSRVVDDAAIDSADVILIFDHEHREALAASYPVALAKTHFMGVLDESGPLEIADPYGASAEKFDEAYSRILRLARGVCAPARSLKASNP